tara:strand:+ start:516 stop:806 length:291 start_codon:yes stop_codon:yes gene_type:complete
MIEIIKEKPIKSSTSVEGILVQVTGGQWYGITRFMAPRNPWMGRAAKATTTGRMDFGAGSETFQKSFTSSPDWEELKTMLMNVLNGEDAIIDKLTY